MIHNPNTETNREALMKALTNPETERRLPSEKLQALIAEEFAKPEEEMDCELLDVCCQALEQRQSPFTEGQIARSERKGLRQFRKRMKQKDTPQRSRASVLVRFATAAAAVLALLLLPAVSLRSSFKTVLPPDEQQYLVVGLEEGDADIARAFADRSTQVRTVHLENLEEIPSVLGYQVELPKWLPEGCRLSGIDVEQTEQRDETVVLYRDEQDPEKRVCVDIMCFSDRTGVAVSYEQNEAGQMITLENGVQIYTARNEQSFWGLYQSEHHDYYMEVTGYDGNVIPELFSSIGGNKEYEEN